MADSPWRAIAATSWALASISGAGKVPSHKRLLLWGSRTSHTHLPPLLRLRTPRYTGCRVSLNFFLPARRLSIVADGEGAGVEVGEGGKGIGTSEGLGERSLEEEETEESSSKSIGGSLVV